MNNQRKFILIAAAVGIIGAFLPWISVSAGILGQDMSQSVNGFHGIGVLYCLVMAAAGVVAFMGDQQSLLDKNMRLVVVAAGAVAIIALLVSFSDMHSSTSAVGGFGVVSASISYGFYLSALAGVAVAVIPFVIKGAGESFAGDLAQLKSSVQSMQNNMATPAAEAPAATAPPAAPVHDKTAELEKLIAWHAEGKITDAEFEAMKAKIL